MVEQTDWVENFRAPSNGLQAKKANQPPRHLRGDWFLKGPIPGAWLEVAVRLPGKALHVSLALWFEAGRKRTGTVTLGHALLRRFNVSRNAGYRALEALASAGLVEVEQRAGRAPRVTLQEATRSCSDGSHRSDLGGCATLNF